MKKTQQKLQSLYFISSFQHHIYISHYIVSCCIIYAYIRFKLQLSWQCNAILATVTFPNNIPDLDYSSKNNVDCDFLPTGGKN